MFDDEDMYDPFDVEVVTCSICDVVFYVDEADDLDIEFCNDC